jgi:VanZ family protein
MLRALAWIALIFFSSTSLAARWCEQAFRLLFGPSSSTPQTRYQILHFLAEKSLHVMLFAVLGWLLWKALPPARGKLVAILLAGLLVGSSSEFLQGFFPGRDPAIRDVLLNFTSMAVVTCVMSIKLGRSSPCPPRPLR